MNQIPAESLSWRMVVLAAYGPTVLVAIGYGSILPLIALSARALGASIGTAALIVALTGIGHLIGDLPAGALAARIGEKRALTAACLVEAAALVAAFLATSLILLATAVLVTGLTGAVVGLARQTYLTEAIPIRLRARALSTLGGSLRLGFFIGPFIGAALVSRWTIGSAYAFAAAMSVAAAVLTSLLPDLPSRHPGRQEASEPSDARSVRRHRGVLSVLAQHRRVLLTLGVGVLVISAARSTRQSIVPLWAESQGIDAATTSVIFGVAAGVELLLFYPGGVIMDRYGRVWVAVPSMIVLGLGFVLLPLTHDPMTLGLVAVLMGLGNGISSGVVMTLGSDASPTESRAQFLGGWRLCADAGSALGPLVISAITLAAPLAVAAVTMGAITWIGTGWLVRWVPAYAPARPAAAEQAHRGQPQEP